MFILKNSILLLLIFCWPIAEAGEGNRKWGVKDNVGYDDYDYMQEEDNTANDSSDHSRDLQTEISINYFGSNLFQNLAEKPCFTPDDVGLLTARSDFEKLLPNSSVVKLENDKSVEAMLEYFYGTQEIVRTFSSEQPQLLSLQALSDLVGGYLNYIYVPLVKQSFYAGQLTYKSVNSVYELHNKCKTFLNTNGNGWREPITDFSKYNFKIDPINVSISLEPGPEQTPCVNLILNDEDNSADIMIVSLPKLDENDDPERLTGIWLPFKRKHSFNLMARSSAFILIRYYVAVMKCYEFQGTSPKKFKNLFGKWISENVLSFLDESEFYPGLGAVLRIVKTLNTDDPEYADDFVEAVPKVATQKSSPEYMQIQDQIVKIQSNKKKSNFFENLLSSSDEEKHKNALILTVMFGLGFAVIVACLAIVWTSCYVKKTRKSNKQSSNESHKSGQKWCNLFRRPFKRKQSDSEEINCAPDSPSVMSRRQEQSFNRKIDSFGSFSSIGSAKLREPKDYMMRGGGSASRQAQEKLIRSSVLGQRSSQAPKVTKSSSIKSLRQHRLKQSKSSNHHRRGSREHLSITPSSSSSVTVSRAPSFREINEKSSVAEPHTGAIATKTDTTKRTKQPTKIPVFRKLPTTNLCCGSVTPNHDVHRCNTFEISGDKHLANKLDNVSTIETPVVLTRKKARKLRCCAIKPKSQSSWETLVSGRR